MNPFSTAPIFVSLSAGFDEDRRNRSASMACLYAFGILVVFLLVGAAIIDFFGISVPGIRVAGGLIISVIGFRMLFPAPPVSMAEQRGLPQMEIALTPIAMPSLAGPGSISVVVTASSQIRGRNPDDFVLVYVGVILGMAVTIVFAWLILRTASSMAKMLGPSGIDAMTRLFGFLLVAIGVQFLLTGFSDFYALRRP